MQCKRILLIESGQFIGGVIHSLFTPYEDFSVIEAAPANTRELMHAIVEHKPDIIVLDDTVREDYLAVLLRHMQRCQGMRVIVVNTNNNGVELYEKQQINLTQTADFFAIL